MSRLVSSQTPEWAQRLELPAYTAKDAARYAKTAPSTVSRWFYGSAASLPALPGKLKGEPLSYLQLVEVAFVATFRNAGVSLQRIRNAREFVKTKLGSEFPFASHRFLTEGTHVLMEMQDQVPEIKTLVKADQNGQVAWKDIMGDRFAQFEYEGDLTIRWHPLGTESPISVDPRIAFGAPAVRGVPTWALRGRSRAGETIDEIAEDFNLTVDEVRLCLEFEAAIPAA